MGAINLASGNIITLGYESNTSISDEELKEWAIEHFEINEYLQELYTLKGYIKLRAQQDYYEMLLDFEQESFNCMEKAINMVNLTTEIVRVGIIPGYYDGFSVTVDIDEREYFEDGKEKELALSEVREVHKLLDNIIDNYSMMVVFPGWCTTLLSWDDSKKAIKKAMAELRRQIRAIPCYSRYRKEV